MIRYFMMGGPVMFPLTLLVLVVFGLTIANLIRLFGFRDSSPGARASINGILFWGVVAAVLGFLGQWIAYHKVATVILDEGSRIGINPKAVILGFGECLVTAAVGLTILIGSSLIWYLLSARWDALAGSKPIG